MSCFARAAAVFGLSLALFVCFQTPFTVGAVADRTDVDWKTMLPEADLVKVIGESVKFLQEATRSQTNFNTKAPLAENEAYVLVIYAEAGLKSGSDDLAGRSAALHKAASRLAEACKDKKLDEAKKQVAAIANFKSMKPDGEMKGAPLAKSVPIKNLMKTVNETDKLMRNYRRLTAAQFNVKGKTDEMALNSLRMAALTGAITAHVPDKDDGKRTRKHWLETTAEVREATIEMANAAKAKKQDQFKTALGKMDSACIRCHDVFRETE